MEIVIELSVPTSARVGPSSCVIVDCTSRALLHPIMARVVIPLAVLTHPIMARGGTFEWFSERAVCILCRHFCGCLHFSSLPSVVMITVPPCEGGACIGAHSTNINTSSFTSIYNNNTVVMHSYCIHLFNAKTLTYLLVMSYILQHSTSLTGIYM